MSSNAWAATPNFVIKNPIGINGSSYNNDLDIGSSKTCLTISPLNKDEIYMGGIALGRSIDGGTNFSRLNTSNQVHPDNRAIKCVQSGNSLKIFTCNDAGIYMSSDNGVTWLTRCNGLGVARSYSVGFAETPLVSSPEKFITGLQDCTTLIRDNTGWFQPNVFGDGMVVAIDPTDNKIMYRESQNGGLEKTINSGVSFSSVPGSGSGGWVTPYLLDPNNNKKLIVGRYDVDIVDFTASSVGTLVTKTITQKPTDVPINTINIAPSNSNIIAVGYQKGVVDIALPNTQVRKLLFISNDGGSTWIDRTPVSFSNKQTAVTSILFHPLNANKIWLTLGGYNWTPTVRRVLFSKDGGVTWTDYTQGLSGMPANTLNINKNRLEDDEIYLGMDVGVFYRNKFMDQWECFTGTLPNVAVLDLKVNQNRKELYAATFGRGIWKTSLFCPSTPSFTLTTSPLGFYAATNTISSTSVINANIPVAYRAPSITLQQGFSVAANTVTEFSAFGYSCTQFTPRSNENVTNGEHIEKYEEPKSELDGIKINTIYPVPTENEIFVNYELRNKEAIAIFLTDINGRYIKHLFRSDDENMGLYTKSFSLKEVKTGVYILSIQSPSSIESRKIIIEK